MERNKSLTNNALTGRVDLEVALTAAGLGVWELDPVTNRVQWDERCGELFGLSKDRRFTYTDTLRYVHPDDVVRVNAAVQWALNPASGGEYEVTYRTIGDDGRTRWIRSVGRSYFDETGRLLRFAGVARDVTESVLHSEKISQMQQMTLSSFEQAPVALAVLTGPDLAFRMANARYRDWVGRSAEQLMNKSLLEAMPELKSLNISEKLHQVIATGIAHSEKEIPFTVYYRPNEPATNYADFTYQPWQQDGQTVGVMIVGTDVTQQVLDRRKIAESELRFRSLVSEAPVATCLVVGRELIIEVANEAMIKLWGKGPNVIGMPLAKALPELEGQPFLPLLDELFMTGRTFMAQAAPGNLFIDGRLQTFYFDFTYKPLRNGDGEVYAIMNMATDVTQQVLAQQKLRQSETRYRDLSASLEIQVQQRTDDLASLNEKLTAANEGLVAANQQYVALNEELASSADLLSRSNENLQQFAYVASHDLQEPLRKILSFGNILMSQYQQSLGNGSMYVERMQSAALRMSTLIRDLLSYSRVATNSDNREQVALGTVVDTVLNDLELVIAETGAQLRIDPLPVVAGNTVQLEQLFQNLLSNALKFRRADVEPLVQVSARIVPLAGLLAGTAPARLVSHYHCIEVADNGIGFNEKYIDRIFQVFQRLHGRSEYAGTGIGLAICERVVTNHGGAITARSTLGQGAVFCVYLPR